MDDAELRALLRLQAEQIAALTAAIKPPVSTDTLAELYKGYEDASKARKSWPTIMYLLRPVLAALGPRIAAELTAADWTAYRTARENDYSGSTLNQQLAWLKTLLRWSVEQGTLPALPHITRARKAKCRTHRETATTEDDVEALLEHARPVERVMVLCACDAGMRRNEIRQLQRTWLDVDRMEIRIPNWAAKGQRGRATPMTARLLAAIRAIPVDIRSHYVLVSPGTVDPYHHITFGKWWRELARKAELQAVPGEDRVRLHDGRHGFATNAVERGGRLEVVSDALGHASLETTRIYVQRRRSDLSQLRESFERGIERDLRR